MLDTVDGHPPRRHPSPSAAAVARTAWISGNLLARNRKGSSRSDWSFLRRHVGRVVVNLTIDGVESVLFYYLTGSTTIGDAVRQQPLSRLSEDPPPLGEYYDRPTAAIPSVSER